MALTRIKTWIAGEVLTASDLNGEFNNIVVYVNALALVSPIADGSPTAPSISISGDSDTGIFSPLDNQIAFTAGGSITFVASGYANGTNYLMAVPGITGQGAVLTASGADTNIALLLRGRGTGYVQASSFVFENFAATQSPTITGRAYWHSAEGSLHISAGTIARVPAITGLQAGDLIIGSNAGGNNGATTYARLGVGPASSYLTTDASRVVGWGSLRTRLQFVDVVGIGGGSTSFLGAWVAATETTVYAQHLITEYGTLRRLHVMVQQAPGAGQDYKFTLRVNQASVFSTITIAGATDSRGSNVADSAAVKPGDIVTLQCTASTTAAANGYVNANVTLEVP